MQTATLMEGDSSTLTPRDFLQVADRIGVDLCRDAFWSGDHCNWMGWSTEHLDGAFTPAFRSCDISLYGGLAGIALFLAHVQSLTGDRQQRTAALGAINNVVAQLGRREAILPGLYTGLAGVAYALAAAGELLELPELAEFGIRVVEQAGQAPLDVARSDVLSGSAGIIPVLIDLGQRFDRPRLLDMAVRHGDFLVDHAVQTPQGTVWPNPNPTEAPLLGYSHGTSGYALALAELNRVRPDARYLASARGALRYERTLFEPSVSNWPDLRVDPQAPDGAPRYPSAWCHGAAGIGLSRLRLLQLLGDDAELLSEIDAALRTASGLLVSQQTTPIGDFSYCHGSCGNAELLLDVAVQLGRGDILEGVRRFGDMGAQAFIGRGVPWPCGVHGGGETPGLMLGKTGIGWFYLRLLDPRRIPSLLVIGPSRATPAVPLEEEDHARRTREEERQHRHD